MEGISEGKIIRSKLLAYGFEKGRVPMELTPEIKRIASLMSNLPANQKVLKFNCSKQQVNVYTEEFLTSHFTIHPVAYLPLEKCQQIWNSYIEGNKIDIDTLSKFNEELEKSVEYINPNQIPIEYISGHSMIGECHKFLTLILDDEYLKKVIIPICKISLGDNITKLSTATKVHEITHTQLERVKQTTKHYHNKEVLPIFLEKVVALELDNSLELLTACETMRFRSFLEYVLDLYEENNHSRTERVEASAYITSTLKAVNLFDRYLESNQEERKEILAGIQMVFDGKTTVEEYLDSQDITLENSTNIGLIQKHLSRR
ncbi:MAG TPA: hypothetical protein IAB56_05205 [Candidatus Scybalousia intestinigallinarum]|nr:hypothetical protein [Candidatus Scybalousia intestinigallinarum]